MCQVVRLIRVTWSGSYAKISVSDDTILKFRIRGICEPEKMKKAKTDFQVSDGFFLALVGIFSFCPWSAWRAARVFRPQSVFVIDSRVACACFCSALGQSSWGFWARPKGALLGLQCIYSLEIAGRLRRNRLVGVKSALFCEKETTTSLVPEVSQRHAAGLNQNRTVLFKKKNKMFPRL